MVDMVVTSDGHTIFYGPEDVANRFGSGRTRNEKNVL